MVSYWIFLVKDHVHMGRIIPAKEVLIDRVKNKFWSLNSRSRNVKKIKPGDLVIFYVTSRDEKGFMGRGVVSTEPHPITPEQRFHVLGIPSEAFDYAVDFSEAEIWDKSIPLEKLMNKISILSGRRSQRAPFRGSVIRVSEKDYQTIIELKTLKNNVKSDLAL
ncbi:MAG: EVE domain-containing protein [Candidatus Caldarchaeales archaeon]